MKSLKLVHGLRAAVGAKETLCGLSNISRTFTYGPRANITCEECKQKAEFWEKYYAKKRRRAELK